MRWNLKKNLKLNRVQYYSIGVYERSGSYHLILFLKLFSMFSIYCSNKTPLIFFARNKLKFFFHINFVNLFFQNVNVWRKRENNKQISHFLLQHIETNCFSFFAWLVFVGFVSFQNTNRSLRSNLSWANLDCGGWGRRGLLYVCVRPLWVRKQINQSCWLKSVTLTGMMCCLKMTSVLSLIRAISF